MKSLVPKLLPSSWSQFWLPHTIYHTVKPISNEPSVLKWSPSEEKHSSTYSLGRLAKFMKIQQLEKKKDVKVGKGR
jgi:hypothetical protein